MVAKNQAKIYTRPHYSPVKIYIQIHYAGRKPMDYDNLVAACKPVIDALKDNGLIYDDSPEHVRAVEVVEAKTPRKDCGTLISIDPA